MRFYEKVRKLEEAAPAEDKPTLIEATSGWRRVDWRQLIAYREVLRMLIRRDLKSRYAQTWLGVGWVVFQPIFSVILFSIVFGKWMHMASDGVPYPLFAFCGLTCWVFIAQAISRASYSLQADNRLITKIYFPRLLMPLAAIIGTLTDFIVLVAILLGLLVIYGVPLTWQICFFPICAVPLCMLSLGIGSFFASVGIYYRDMMALLPFFIQTWMYGSPVVYSASIIPEKWRTFFQLNPLMGILDAMRWSFLGLAEFPLQSFTIACSVSFAVCLASLLIFVRLERQFADVL